MKALSVREPFASRIARGEKTIEVRSRRTHYRGLLAICASRGGGAVAVVELVDCRPFVASDDEAAGGTWTRCPECREGHFAWVVRVVRRVESPVIKGKLGFFEVDESTFRAPPKARVTAAGCWGGGF